MPFPLPPGHGVTCSRETILARPDIAAKIGQIANAWNLFESNVLNFYFQLLARAFVGQDGKLVGHRISIAHHIFDELESFRAKQDLFERLLRDSVEPSVFKQYEDTVQKKIKAASKARNRVVHTVWGLPTKGHELVFPDAVATMPVSGPAQVWRIADFNEELNKIEDAALALGKLLTQLMKLWT